MAFSAVLLHVVLATPVPDAAVDGHAAFAMGSGDRTKTKTKTKTKLKKKRLQKKQERGSILWFGVWGRCVCVMCDV